MGLQAPSFSIDSTAGDGYQLVALSGEFDLSAKAAADAELTRLLAGEPGALIVDLRGLSFIDSSGFHSLVVLNQDCQRSGRPLRVVRGNVQISRILALCGLDSRLAMFDLPAEAIAGSVSAAA